MEKKLFIFMCVYIYTVVSMICCTSHLLPTFEGMFTSCDLLVLCE